jgi:LysR family pca operon transcriptional activator
MIENRIKFRHLLCFLEVARLKSVVKAAANLSVTQPAVSRTLRELEETLGVPLFDRSHRNLALTHFGEVFQRYAGASVTALRQGVDSITQARAKGGYTIRVGALPTVASGLLPAALLALKKSGLESTVRVVSGRNTELLAQLRVGDLDLLIGRLPAPEQMTGLSFEPLYSDQAAFLVRPGHPLLADQPLDLVRVAAYTLLMPAEESNIRPFIDRMLITHGISAFPDRIETVSVAFGRSYTLRSDAVWIISHGVAVEEIVEGRLVELPVDTRETRGPVGMTMRTDVQPPPAAQLVMQAVRDVVRDGQKLDGSST